MNASQMQNFTWDPYDSPNFTDCSNSCDDSDENLSESSIIDVPAQMTMLVGSFLSLICTSTAMMIFIYFRSFWCDCVNIQIHLTAAHMLRSLVLPLISGPFSSQEFYVAWPNMSICKTLLVLYWYATFSSYIWILILSVHVNCKLTPDIKLVASTMTKYYIFGWVTPILYLAVYLYFWKHQHLKITCWTAYNETHISWIFRVPTAYLVLWNVGILVNIVWILHTKAYKKGKINDIWRIRHLIKLAKTTLVLSSILAITTMFFMLLRSYALCSSIFGSLQGSIVALTCCFCNAEVWKAGRFSYRRFRARRKLVGRRPEIV